jgi:putative cell wall-binding protein
VEEEEEKEADPKPLATKIKKILYSDKSESSIDEMMEDTPSNYNIPNGRLDGRTLDMKKLQAKERVRGHAKQLESGNYLQKTL